MLATHNAAVTQLKRQEKGNSSNTNTVLLRWHKLSPLNLQILLSKYYMLEQVHSQTNNMQTAYPAYCVGTKSINPLTYTDVPETAGLARSINTQPAVRRNSETNPTSRHNRGMY